jgi:hypothetical protein
MGLIQSNPYISVKEFTKLPGARARLIAMMGQEAITAQYDRVAPWYRALSPLS